MVTRLPIKEFKYGQIDSIEASAIPRGSASRALNWLTQGVKIELRRGMDSLGLTENTGAGRITGLGVALKPNGDEVVIRTRKRKIEYLDTTTGDWVEIGTDSLPAAVVASNALGEEISIQPYQNLTGYQVWLNSPNAGPYKIMTANMGSYTDMNHANNYKGKMRIKQNRMFLWDRGGTTKDKINIYGSKLDLKDDGEYTTITAEAIAGSGTTRSGTLAFKAAGSKRTCFSITFTDGTETFTDNGDGTLTGSAGGTGTINYTSGVYAITFNASAVTVTATYQWADDTDGGIADFRFSGTRLAGEGFIRLQGASGNFQNIASYNLKEYCFHESKTWLLDIAVDDSSVNSIIYRDRVGIPNHRAMVETGDGIYYIDDTDKNNPHFRLMTLARQTSEVVPKSISKQRKIAEIEVGVDLTQYMFDRSVAIEFGDLVLFACRTLNSETNNRVFIYNKINQSFDVADYTVSCFAIYEGTLIAGDDVSDNVYTLLSGTDDDQSYIGNYWEGSLDNFDVDKMKRAVEVVVDGEIGPEQAIKISASVDNGSFVEIRADNDYIEAIQLTETVPAVVTNDGSLGATTPISLRTLFVDDGISFGPFIAKQPTLTKVYLYSEGVNGSPVSGVTVRLVAAGNFTILGEASVSAATWIAGQGSEIEFVFNTPPALSVGSQYRIEIFCSIAETSGNSFKLGQYFTGNKANGTSDYYVNSNNAQAQWVSQTFISNLPSSVYRTVQETPAIPATYTEAVDNHAIEGDEYYVDTTQSVNVGSYTYGRGEVGGSGAGLQAYHYRRQFRITLDKFEFIKIRFEAMRLGYASISEFTFHDVRVKFGKVTNRYREQK